MKTYKQFLRKWGGKLLALLIAFVMIFTGFIVIFTQL